jgi:hypothetical protein
VDNFGRKILAWASMGLESHRWMPRAHMLDVKDKHLENEKMMQKTYPNPHMPNDFPERGKMSHF